MTLAIGIDLGTTNSVAGLMTSSGVRLCTDASGSTIHPSVVSFPESGGILVGNAARVRKATDPTRTVYSAKRLIGQNVRAPLVQLAMASLPYQVEEGNNRQPIIGAAGRRMTVPEVSALVLGHLTKLCEAQFGHEVSEAVITVPANFSDAQRQATKEAGRIAGLEVLRLVNEPTAAALAYGYGQGKSDQVAVFDFGGGTFDVSILKIESDIFEVLATDGEFFLGGDDIDRIVAEHLAAEMNRRHNVDPRPIATAMNRLGIAAEQIKRYLSAHHEAEGTIDGIVVNEGGRSLSIDFSIKRRQFDDMITGYVDRTIEVCRNVLSTAGLTPRDVSEVILVGGTTRIPLVRDRVAELFGREPATRINPDEVVAQGAAVQAAMLCSHSGLAVPANAGAQAEFGSALDLGFSEEATAKDLRPVPVADDAQPPTAEAAPSTSVPRPAGALLLDVTPATLRMGTAGGYTEVFLERNSPIPIERTRIFTTAHDEQTQVLLQCCRGEHRSFEDNELLGTLTLDEIPRGPRGQAEIEVTFRVDPDSILHVRAIERRTGKLVEARLEVVGAPEPRSLA